MKTAILSTGSELLRGTIQDTNASWLAKQLCEHGIQPLQFVTIGDNVTQLSQTLKTLWQSFDLVICTGGLGPTTDDITATAVASALGVIAIRNPDAEKQVKERFAARNVSMSPINLKQADIPMGCTVLKNSMGTAPGFLANHSNCNSYFLPGVPSEMKVMFQQHILSFIQKSAVPMVTRQCRTFGIGESSLQERLLPIESQFPALTFSYRAAFPTITTTIWGKDEQQVCNAHSQTQSALAEFVFSTQDNSMAHVLGQTLQNQSLTIATAESCTGGQIGHELTQIAGSSQYVKGGVIAYDNTIKTNVLGVSPQLIENHGAVSEAVVCEMARGVQKIMNTDIAVATSGIAGPGGGTTEKPVGTVHMAVRYGNNIFHKKCLFKGYSRTKVKTASTWTAMKLVLDHLLEKR